MKAEHTQGPWEVDSTSLCIVIGESCIADCTVDPALTIEAKEANAERIVACVNACEGIDDPAKAIELARISLNQILMLRGDGDIPSWCPSLDVASDALAALTPLPSVG